jgi:hypothetical protein
LLSGDLFIFIYASLPSTCASSVSRLAINAENTDESSAFGEWEKPRFPELQQNELCMTLRCQP